MKGSLFSRPSSPLPESHHSNYVSPSSTPSRMQLQTFSETLMEENIDFAEKIIKKWDLDSMEHRKFRSLFEHDRDEAKRFLESVSDLQKAMHFYVKLNTNSEKLTRAQKHGRTSYEAREAIASGPSSHRGPKKSLISCC